MCSKVFDRPLTSVTSALYVEKNLLSLWRDIVKSLLKISSRLGRQIFVAQEILHLPDLCEVCIKKMAVKRQVLSEFF